MMKCEKCGKEINTLLINKFDCYGSDVFCEYPLSECDVNSVLIDTDRNWTGYELSDDEKTETVVCPNCKKYPFKDKEIQEHEIVRLVMFKSEEKEVKK